MYYGQLRNYALLSLFSDYVSNVERVWMCLNFNRFDFMHL